MKSEAVDRRRDRGFRSIHCDLLGDSSFYHAVDSDLRRQRIVLMNEQSDPSARDSIRQKTCENVVQFIVERADGILVDCLKSGRRFIVFHVGTIAHFVREVSA